MIIKPEEFFNEEEGTSLFKSTAMQEVQYLQFSTNQNDKNKRLQLALDYQIFTADTALHGSIRRREP